MSSGDIVALDIVADGIPNSDGVNIYLDFNSSVIVWEGNSTNDPDGFEKGDLFGSQSMYMINNNINPDSSVNEDRLILGIHDSSGPRGGSGTVMTVVFRIVGIGSTGIGFAEGGLLGSGSQPVFVNATLEEAETNPVVEDPDDPPEVSLDLPESGTVFGTGDVQLLCSASDDTDLDRLTLLLNDGSVTDRYDKLDTPDDFFAGNYHFQGLADGNYQWNCEAEDGAGQVSQGDQWFSFTVSIPSDPDPPVLSQGQPSGNISDPDLDISVQTSEDAECRYSMVPGTGFNVMNKTMNTSDSRLHYADVFMNASTTYRFYVRCSDGNGNRNQDDYEIDFYLNSQTQDSEPPQIISASPEGDSMEEGTRTVLLELSTHEVSECRFDFSPGQDFSSMDQFTNTFTTNHSHVLSEIVDGRSYSVYVKCRDLEGNVNVDDYLISFSVQGTAVVQDTSPPEISGTFPDSDLSWSRNFNVSFRTNENAECRISESSGQAFDSMSLVSFKSENKHWEKIGSASEGQENVYYVRCKDEKGNMNTETEIRFFMCLESDQDCSRSVETPELMDFVDRWFVSVDDVSMHRLMESIRVWKGG